jgi:hypothetical protein
VQPKVTTPTNTQLSVTLKIALLIVASSFLAYSVYWLINGVIWGYTVTQMLLHINQISMLTSMGAAELTALFIQESCSVANSFVLLFCGVFAFQSAVFYVRKKPKYFQRLRWALVLLAVFSLLLMPASVHHLLGVAFGWFMVDVYVGLSYLLQALLIVPPLLILSQKMRKPQDTAPILKWATIAAPLFVFALWLKYVFLWMDTLVPMNTHESYPLSTVGAVNAIFTLLIAALAITVGCLKLNKNRTGAKKLFAVGLVLVGGFFIVFSVVAVFVPIYASFWYLTDFWMLTLPTLGVVLLVKSPKKSTPLQVTA